MSLQIEDEIILFKVLDAHYYYGYSPRMDMFGDVVSFHHMDR